MCSIKQNYRISCCSQLTLKNKSPKRHSKILQKLWCCRNILQLKFSLPNIHKHNDDDCGTSKKYFRSVPQTSISCTFVNAIKSWLYILYKCFVTFWRQFFINQAWWSLNLSVYLKIAPQSSNHRAYFQFFYEHVCI